MKMIRPIIAAFLIISASLINNAHAQVEVTPMASYTLADKFDTYRANAKILDNFAWGLNVAFNLGYGKQIELGYERLDTDVTGEEYIWTGNGYISNGRQTIGVAMDYILAGFIYNREMPGSAAVPFGGVSLGTAIATGQDGDYKGNDLWFFDANIKLGVKIFPSEKVGIRLQAQLHMPMQGSGGSISCGVGTGGSGCGVGFGGYTTITQLNFGGGLILRLGGDAPNNATGKRKAPDEDFSNLAWGSL